MYPKTGGILMKEKIIAPAVVCSILDDLEQGLKIASHP